MDSVFQELVTLARCRGPRPILYRNRWICSFALYPRHHRSLRLGRHRTRLLSRMTLMVPDHHPHPHQRPNHHHLRRHCVQTIRPREQHRHMFGSSVVAGSTLNQEKAGKRSYSLGVRDGCLSCGGVALTRQVASVVPGAKEKVLMVAHV